MTNSIRPLINIIQEGTKIKKHPWVSSEDTVAKARKLAKTEPRAVRFNNTGRGSPDTRVWAQEWDSDEDPLLGAVRYGASRGRPAYFTLEPNSENPDLIYIDIYY